MCYSAQVEASIRKLERKFHAKVDYASFEKLFGQRLTMDGIKIPKALELSFEEPRNAAENRIKASIEEFRRNKTRSLEQELFKQKKRLADAERSLKTKSTKKALDDRRIATDKIEALLKRITDVSRTEPQENDTRIFPFYYAPIVVNDGDGPKLIAARYHCRPAGKPAYYDKKFDGLYTARKDSLEKFWKKLFGSHHAVLVMKSFYENVALHKVEHRELQPGEHPKNIVLHFNPKPAMDMVVACLWSRWESNVEPELTSFAAITDDPPPEIAAAGHDRVVITLKDRNVDAWLKPAGVETASLYQLLNDRERPYFEYRKAA